MCSVKIQERQKALWSCCGRGLEAENYKWKVQTVTKLKFVLIFTLTLKVKRRYFCSKVWEDSWRTFKDATLDVLKGLNYTAYLWNTFCVKFHQKYIKTFYLNKSRRLQHPSNLVVRFVCSEEAKEVLTQCNFSSSTGCFNKCPKAMFVLFLFSKSDLTFSHVFWNQNFELISFKQYPFRISIAKTHARLFHSSQPSRVKLELCCFCTSSPNPIRLGWHLFYCQDEMDSKHMWKSQIWLLEQHYLWDIFWDNL